LLVSNLFLHAEYYRRRRAIRSIRHVQAQLLQAQTWFQDYELQNRHPRAREVWLDYLHCLVLRQFDLDVWQEVLAQNKKYEELTPATTTTHSTDNPPIFTWDEMYPLFYDRSLGGPGEDRYGPHLATGNKMHYTDPREVINYLFKWRDRKQRRGWSASNFHVATQRIFTMISHFLGDQAAQTWFDGLVGLVLLTRWILPYPCDSSLFAFTKSHRSKGLVRRVTWFSSTFYRALEDEKWTPAFLFQIRPELGGTVVNVITLMS
ncbi:uncharacterized protein P884DRAFT_319465, partial [Thermothelomyces heterothallicus CBS 202.75]|uniref:uncharacterized protein n=1 Tax=Thermothelomyces heterothallicus CBS 202.75 TaxID=1149848 RepID=UPI0037424F6E